jgi:hypothetical protein
LDRETRTASLPALDNDTPDEGLLAMDGSLRSPHIDKTVVISAGADQPADRMLSRVHRSLSCSCLSTTFHPALMVILHLADRQTVFLALSGPPVDSTEAVLAAGDV